MSRLKNATIAAVCALGASTAMITPASAIGAASAPYDCGAWGNPVTVAFTRSAPAPGFRNLDVSLPISIYSGVPLVPGGIAGTLNSPPGPPYPIAAANTNVAPPGIVNPVRLKGVSPATLTGPPSSIVIHYGVPDIVIVCVLLPSPAPIGWPI